MRCLANTTSDDIRSLDGHLHFQNYNFLMLVMRMMVRKMTMIFFLVFVETLEVVGTELKVNIVSLSLFLSTFLLPFNPEVKFNARKLKLWGSKVGFSICSV